MTTLGWVSAALALLVGYEIGYAAGARRKIAPVKRPPRPGRVSQAEKRSIDMAFGLKFTLPPSGAADVVKRDLTVTVEGGQPETRSYDAPAALSDEWVFEQDAKIVATLVDVDDVGNESQPSPPFEATVSDDIPPGAPGALGVTEKREI